MPFRKSSLAPLMGALYQEYEIAERLFIMKAPALPSSVSFRRGNQNALIKILRAMAFALLRLSGLPHLIRETIQRKKVTIIVYHDLKPERADIHLAILRDRYNIIALADFIDSAARGGINQLPPKSLIVTFDDGHDGNYRLVPVLKKHGLPVTIFLCSGIVGTRRHYWWRHVKDVREAKRLKVVPDEQRVKVMLENGHTDVREYEMRQALSRDEIAEMKSFVDFQSHTVFHPILPACSLERACKEVAESKSALEVEHGLKVYALAYPNGDYSDREIAMLQDAGYTCGLTLDAGFNNSETDLFRIRRLVLDDDAGVNELIVKTSGLWAAIEAFRLKIANLMCWSRR